MSKLPPHNAAVLFVLLLLLCPAPPPAMADESAKVLENPLIDVMRQQKKVYYMKQGIKTQQAILQRTSAKDRSLLSELGEINQQLKEFGSTRDALQSSIRKQEGLLKENQLELIRLAAEKEELRLKMQARLRAYYRMGDIGVLNVIFSNASLGDYLSFKEYFQKLLQHDQQLANDYRGKLAELAESSSRLSQGREQLLSAEAQVAEQEEQLKKSRQNRQTLLTEVRTEKTLYLMAIKEIQGAADQLTATIEQLKKAAEKKQQDEREKTAKEAEVVQLTGMGKRPVNPEAARTAVVAASRNNAPGSFSSRKGRLDPPAPGMVVTYFGKNKTGKFGVTTYENGIDIKINPGTKIRAVHEGTVVYAGILQGYGKLLIIDHGDQYYSLISRVAELFKKEQDTVRQGEVVAVMSDESGLLNDGLHFEIRHGSLPVNPLEWLNRAKLRLDGDRRG